MQQLKATIMGLTATDCIGSHIIPCWMPPILNIVDGWMADLFFNAMCIKLSFWSLLSLIFAHITHKIRLNNQNFSCFSSFCPKFDPLKSIWKMCTRKLFHVCTPSTTQCLSEITVKEYSFLIIRLVFIFPPWKRLHRILFFFWLETGLFLFFVWKHSRYCIALITNWKCCFSFFELVFCFQCTHTHQITQTNKNYKIIFRDSCKWWGTN